MFLDAKIQPSKAKDKTYGHELRNALNQLKLLRRKHLRHCCAAHLWA